MSESGIELADQAEEVAARFALRAAKDKDELISVWWREAEHFAGPARARLQDEFAERLRKFGALQG